MGAQSLLSDPEFQSLPADQQKKALAGIDSEFGNLSDDQFNQVKAGLTTKTAPAPNFKRAKSSLTGREAPAPSTAAQLADLAEGTAKYSSGALLPAAVMNPLATAGALVGGTAANLVGNYGSQVFGADPDTGRLIGDVTSIPGAMAGESPALWGGVKGVVKAVPQAVKDASVPGMGAILGHNIPGVSQVMDFLTAMRAAPALFEGAKAGTAGKSVIGPNAEMFRPPGVPAPPSTPPPPAYEGPYKPNPRVIKTPYGGSDNPYGGSSFRNRPSRPAIASDPNVVGAPPVTASPAETGAGTGTGTGEGPTVAPGQVPVRQHETNVKVDQQITNKVNNLAQYLRSKGGTAENLDQIVADPALNRQYLNEAHSYGKSQGNPVPKTQYKGLDPGSDTHIAVRQKILDLIESEKAGGQ